MATDEEMRKEANKLGKIWINNKWSTTELLINAIKKGIRMERQRLKKQVKKTSEDQQCPDILIDDIDIWDDE